MKVSDHICKEVPKGYPKCCEESYRIGYHIGHEDGSKSGIKEAIEWVNKWKELAEHGDYSNGVEAFGMDEGRVLSYRYIKDLEEQWQSKLKEWGLNEQT
jgi:hypothetical protein